MFRNLRLTFKVLDFRFIRRQWNLLANITFFFFKVQAQASTFFFNVKVVGGIFRFRISKTTQLNLFNLKFSKTKILINIGF